MLKCASFSFMNHSEHDFEETGQCASHKICGTCGRIKFGLSEADQTLLNKLMSWHGAELMRSWLKKGTVKISGGGCRVDQQKTGAVKIILENPAYCRAAKTKVFYITGSCFAWISRRGYPSPRLFTTSGSPHRDSSHRKGINHKKPPMESHVESMLKRKKSVTIYISTDVLERVTAEAKQQNRSVSNTIETLLTKSL